VIIHAISDLHGHFPKLNGKADLLIVAGDFADNDSLHKYKEFEKWFDALSYAVKIMVPGNHDTLVEWRVLQEPGHWLKSNKVELTNHSLTLESVLIHGFSYTLQFENMNPLCKAFTVENEKQMKEKLSWIPDNVDILVSHAAAYGVLDGAYYEWTGKTSHFGSKAILDTLKRVQPRVFICGHIHEGFGQHEMKHDSGKITRCYNVSHVNEHYQPVNAVTEIKI